MGWWERIDPGLRAFMEWAEAHVTALDYLRALDQCHHLNRRFAAVFADVDVLVTPALAAVPPVQGQFGVVNGEPDPNWVRFTYPFNLTKLPAGVVTAGFSQTGLPIGLQVAGPQHGDLLTLRVLAALEDALGHVERLPLLEAPPGPGAGSPS
jgi:aspartyl-tRNA(Asn)/glutamyl-tRNA(Gln) amidotransferase subunit A